MYKKITRIAILVCLFILPLISHSGVKGIYLTQYTLENTAYLHYLIKHAKESGIDTFVIDLEKPTKRYRDNIAKVKAHNIRYVARIVMFPHGGTPSVVRNPEIWQKKYRLVQQAADWGANEIQLDYIRYNTKQPASSENAKHVLEVITWFKNKLSPQNIPLQVDVFGIASFGEAKNIGQNIKLFAQSVDAVCPMVYPSHYEPSLYHFKNPYDTVYDSLVSIQDQFPSEKPPIKIYAFIELSNYRYPMSRPKTLGYINEQIQAVKDAEVDGWYAWSAHNRYDNLFTVLRQQNGTRSAVNTVANTTTNSPANPIANTPAKF